MCYGTVELWGWFCTDKALYMISYKESYAIRFVVTLHNSLRTLHVSKHQTKMMF